MTTITAKIVADSISPDGIRLVSVEMRYPRIIHSELMTHRVFSRNARSSRAVPVARMIQEVIEAPFVPLFWGKNQKGMQAGESFDLAEIEEFKQEWLDARHDAVRRAEWYMNRSVHKQVVNRLLEPFSHIDVLVTSTIWANFFALRDHKDAEPHIAILARETRAAMNASTPKLLKPGEWHLPYVEDDDLALGRDVCIKLSVARCARISYKPFDGDGSIESELRRYDDLVGSQPLHASPAEHQATPDGLVYDDSLDTSWRQPHLHGNLTGWIQYRKTLPNEAVTD